METATDTGPNKGALRRRLKALRAACEKFRTQLDDLTENVDEAENATSVFDLEDHLQALADNAQVIERDARKHLVKIKALREELSAHDLEIELAP